MSKISYSIVTVSFNRTEHLLESAYAVSSLNGHKEHVILDFGSAIPVRREQLPRDNRINLCRVESPTGKWWLTHAYNLAFSLAEGDYLLKLDADVILSQEFINMLLHQRLRTNAQFMCSRLTLQDWILPTSLFTTNGLFFCQQESLAAVRGFNPYIQGWGWDEIDLYSRLFLAGFSVSRIPQGGLTLIQHDDVVREHPIGNVDTRSCPIPQSWLDDITPSRRMQAQNEKNKQIAAASINKRLGWPSLEEYARSYQYTASLPVLPKASLFDATEKQALTDGLTRQLLEPSRFLHRVYRIMSMFQSGPYTTVNAEALLALCNINIDLVA